MSIPVKGRNACSFYNYSRRKLLGATSARSCQMVNVCYVCLIPIPNQFILVTMGFSNHPVIREDGLLSTFLTEPAFEEWRKHTSVSMEEESASKRIDRVEEMTIPSDLDEKLQYVFLSVSLVVSMN